MRTDLTASQAGTTPATGQLVRFPWELPVMSGVCERLTTAALGESTAPAELLAIVRSDPGLVAFALADVERAEASTLTDTLDLAAVLEQLGRERLLRMSMLVGPPPFSGTPEEIGGRTSIHRRLWQHAVALAATARRLAQEFGFSGRSPDEVHTAALLVHLGALSMQMAEPERAVELRARMRSKPRTELVKIECELFGRDRYSHALELARAWSLPIVMTDVFGCLRDSAVDLDCPRDVVELVHLLQAAEELVAQWGLSSLEGAKSGRMELEVSALLTAVSADETQGEVAGEVELLRGTCTLPSLETAARSSRFERLARQFARELHQSEGRLHLARSLNEVMQYGLRRLDDRDPMPGLLVQAVRFMGYRRICHLGMDAEQMKLIVKRCAASNVSERVEEGSTIGFSPDAELFQRSCVVTQDHAAPEARQLLDLLGVSSCLLAPLGLETPHTLGFMCADRASAGITPGEERGFGLLVEQAGHLLRYEAMQNDLKRLATVDPLTGAATRRRLMDRLELHIMQYERTLLPMSLCLLDLDHFKRFNDTMGHQVGDRLLQDLVKVLEANLRRTDLVARYGGEEFVVLLPQARLKDARRVADELRQAVWDYGQEAAAEYSGMPVSVSIGVTEMQPSDTAAAMIARADAALYRAKNAGRNRVEAG
jgi:diguanylate cyclase (GGDEF)-like protein